MKIFVLLFFIGACSTKLPYTISDHFDGQRFHNVPPSPPKGFWEVMKWRLFGRRGEWREEAIQKITVNDNLSYENVKVTFLNHASFLLQFKSLNIITDPIWSERASPVSFAGPKRAYVVPIKIEELPNIDIIIISHNHYDHLDLPTLIKLQEHSRPIILVPLGDREWLEKKGLKNVFEMDWWEQKKIGELTITFAPARHWSARGMFDRNLSLWGSFLLEDANIKIYFAGDTGYGDHFKEVFRRFGALDVALLPIGAYEPRDFMKEQHMNPEDAVKAHFDLQSKKSIGMHFGTFQLTDEDQKAPELDLEKELIKKQISSDSFIVPKPSEIFYY